MRLINPSHGLPTFPACHEMGPQALQGNLYMDKSGNHVQATKVNMQDIHTKKKPTLQTKAIATANRSPLPAAYIKKQQNTRAKERKKTIIPDPSLLLCTYVNTYPPQRVAHLQNIRPQLIPKCQKADHGEEEKEEEKKAEIPRLAVAGLLLRVNVPDHVVWQSVDLVSRALRHLCESLRLGLVLKGVGREIDACKSGLVWCLRGLRSFRTYRHGARRP